MSDVTHAKIIILGSGPAGATAAIYAARAMMEPLMIAGMQPGGQLTITTEVENYPGFAKAIQGPWLMEEMKAQARHVGTEVISDTVTEVRLKDKPIWLKGDSGQEYTCDALIICVPTPLKANREPDLSYVVKTVESIVPHLRAGQGILERQAHARLEVGSALRLRPSPPATTATTEDPTELAEQIGKVDVLVSEPARARAATPPGAVGSEGVVLLALLGIRQRVVRALDLLEPLLGRRVALIRIGVALAGKLAVGLLDLVVGCRLRHAENLVGSAGHSYSATITRAGRRTASPSR